MRTAAPLPTSGLAPPGTSRVASRALAAVAILALVLSWRKAGIHPSLLFDRASLASVGAFVSGLFPPDVTPAFLGVVLVATLRTLAIAVAGTFLSVLLALPLGVFATPTLWHRGVIIAGERPGAATFALGAVSHGTRAFLRFLRAVPDLMWALVFVVAVGLGPLPGALALGVSYAGVLGRVYADVFEGVDAGPIEALHATGATRLQIFVVAIWPQAAPAVTAYTLYSFECCVRAASVLGFIGAGGIGTEIYLSMRLFEYGQVLTLVAAFVLLVTATDALSRWLRRYAERARVGGRVGTAGRVARWAVGAGAVLASFVASGFFDAGSDGGLARHVARFVRELVPDLEWSFVKSLAEPLLQTLAISVVGTLLGVVIGASLALPATATLALPRDETPGRRSLADRASRALVYRGARLALSLLRSIPELVWVLVCILAVGLGPFAGTLAIGLHTGGVLGKLYAETLEEVPDAPVEALRANGAGAVQCLVWGIWPQARAMIASYTVLRWETNLRAATVVGLVGGGGLGLVIYNNVQLGFYGRVATLILVVYALVVLTDRLADRLRLRTMSRGAELRQEA